MVKVGHRRSIFILMHQKEGNTCPKKAGGVMVWQLLQDSAGSNSLLGAIADTIKETTTAH